MFTCYSYICTPTPTTSDTASAPAYTPRNVRSNKKGREPRDRSTGSRSWFPPSGETDERPRPIIKLLLFFAPILVTAVLRAGRLREAQAGLCSLDLENSHLEVGVVERGVNLEREEMSRAPLEASRMHPSTHPSRCACGYPVIETWSNYQQTRLQTVASRASLPGGEGCGDAAWRVVSTVTMAASVIFVRGLSGPPSGKDVGRIATDAASLKLT